MEAIMAVVTWVSTNYASILLAVTSIVTGASIIVKLTPTQKDDAALATVVKVLEFISMNKR